MYRTKKKTMEYNHPTSFTKNKSRQKHLLLLAAIAIPAALSFYFVFNHTREKDPPRETVTKTAAIPDSTGMNQADTDQREQDFFRPPFDSLDIETKKIILSESYIDGTSYQITSDAERALSVICYGDFNADGRKDVAIVIDNDEKQSCRLLIICTHTAGSEKYLAFSEDYSDKIKINAFGKGTKIILNRELPEPSAVDGVIANGEDVKLAVVYDMQQQKFDTFYQE
jgi:hypothetical protein